MKNYVPALSLAIAVSCLAAFPAAMAGTATETLPLPDAQTQADFRHAAEFLCGKTFRHEVPAVVLAEPEMRALLNRKFAWAFLGDKLTAGSIPLPEARAAVEREFVQRFPGQNFASHQELLKRLDLFTLNWGVEGWSKFDAKDDLPPVLYDADTGRMYYCAAGDGRQAKATAVTPEARLTASWHNTLMQYVEALESQHGRRQARNGQPETAVNSDAAAAWASLLDGTRMHLLHEADLGWRQTPETFAFAWPVFHSAWFQPGSGDYVSWAGCEWNPAASGETAGLQRVNNIGGRYYCHEEHTSETRIPGHPFVRRLMRDWGLDGLDYACAHPPASSAQLIHPEKYWGDCEPPVSITLPPTLPGGWTRLAEDTLGEAGVITIFHRGERIGRGWNGDRAALYGTPDGRRLLLWASAWDSESAAARFAEACMRFPGRNANDKVSPDGWSQWTRDGQRTGQLRRDGRHVILLETDAPAALAVGTNLPAAVAFAAPPEDAASRHHTVFRRFNPFFARRTEGKRAVTGVLWGGIWRHERNPVGTADRALFGLADCRRTPSFLRWSAAWGTVARHERDDRRGIRNTTLLPAGLLWSRFSARLPEDPTDTVTRDSVGWNWVGSWARSRDTHHVSLLPGGLLLNSQADKYTRKLSFAGTGYSRTVDERTLHLLPLRLANYSRKTGHPATGDLGWGLLARRENDEASVLPWGLLWSRTRNNKGWEGDTIEDTMGWGWLAQWKHGRNANRLELLPLRLIYSNQTEGNNQGVLVWGTGWSCYDATTNGMRATRHCISLFGFPLYESNLRLSSD